jgi:hypothetical protein
MSVRAYESPHGRWKPALRHETRCSVAGFSTFHANSYDLIRSSPRLDINIRQQGMFEMTSFLNFHAFAAARGDGLRPELRAAFRTRCGGSALRTHCTKRRYGPVGSGSNIRGGCARARNHVALSANFSPPDTRSEP